MRYIISFLFSLLSIPASSCFGQSSVQIGNQIWMTKNLDVEKFRNGDPIMQVRSVAEMKKADEEKKPAWCYLNFDPVNGIKFGRLYNWYAVNDPRGLAPSGWHIPSIIEWYEMFEYLGGEKIAGAKMKSVVGWSDYLPIDGEWWRNQLKNAKGTNESGLNIVPSGPNDSSHPEKTHAYFWSSTEADDENGFYTELSWIWSEVRRGKINKFLFCGIRCVLNK